MDTIRGAHRAYGFCEAWYGGQRLTLVDDRDRPTTRLPLDLAGQNQVTIDGSTPGPRRALSATLAPTSGLWEALAPVGTELRAYTALKTTDGEAVVPQGVFPIDVQKATYGPTGGMSITAPDRWVLIQNARFLTPRQFGGSSVRDLITTLLLEALPAGSSVTDLSTSTARVPVQTEDRDRAGLIQKLATAASLDVSFDRNGNVIIRDIPKITTDPVWSVNAGPGGVLVAADRERNRQKTYNLVVVNGTKNDDGTAPFPTVYVWDNDPTSPTFCGPGNGFGPVPPLPSQAGPFGQRATFYSSPLLTDINQAITAGATILARVTGLAAQLTAAAISNPALDDGDTIRVVFPPPRRNEPRPTELHLIDALTVPLVPSKNTQQITTRSTRADNVQDS